MAKQSNLLRITGLLRRCAPRNDEAAASVLKAHRHPHNDVFGGRAGVLTAILAAAVKTTK
jgi:hypothetical protein